MSFWKRLSEGFWRLKLPSEPPKLAPGEERGAMKDGKKQGLWVERLKSGHSTVLFYEAGTRHGPFRDYYPTGERKIEGAHLDGELDGSWRTFHKTGEVAGIATFARGKLEGTHRMYLPTGEVKLESEYIHNQRHGPWRLLHDDGALHELGAHDLGLRVGPWKIYDAKGRLREEGTFDAGEREGVFLFRDEAGDIVLEASFAAGVLTGPFRVATKGTSVAEGRFHEGVIEPDPVLAANAAAELVAHPPPEPIVRRWVEIESALARLSPPTKLPKAFVDLGDEPEAVDDAEYAKRVESHEAWLMLFTDTMKLEIEAREIVARRVETRLAKSPGALLPEVGYPAWHHLVGTREPHALARFVSTICLDHAHFDEESSTRFRARFARQLRRLSLFECTFDPSLETFLRGTDFETLLALEIADYDRKGRGLLALPELGWARRLVRLAFDGTEAHYEDEQLASLFATEGLPALRSLSLGVAEAGEATAKAFSSGELAGRLDELHFVESQLSDSALEALAKNAKALKRLKLERCTMSPLAHELVRAWAEKAELRLVIVEDD